MANKTHDTTTTITELRNKLKKFSEERDWVKSYSEAGLAKSIVLEAAELLEHFQWHDTPDYDKKEVAFELIDIIYYALMLSELLDIDIMEYTDLKLENLASRYPKKK